MIECYAMLFILAKHTNNILVNEGSFLKRQRAILTLETIQK